MTDELYNLHLNAGRLSGKDKTCGKKINYITEASADKSAKALNKSMKSRRELEAYPCFFCKGWHIGGKMPLEVLRSFVAEDL